MPAKLGGHLEAGYTALNRGTKVRILPSQPEFVKFWFARLGNRAPGRMTGRILVPQLWMAKSGISIPRDSNPSLPARVRKVLVRPGIP